MTIVYSAAMERARVLAGQRPAPVKPPNYVALALAAVNSGHYETTKIQAVTGVPLVPLYKALSQLATTGRIVRAGRGMYRRGM